MLELYAFGFNGHSQLQPTSPASKDNILVPKSVVQGHSLQILWSSWCDALVIHQLLPSSQPEILYTGSGLTEPQIAHVKHLVQSAKDNAHLQFFGTPLGSGLQGILNTSSSTVTLFSDSGPSTKEGPCEISTYTPPDSLCIQHIALASGGHVSLVVSHPRYTGSSIATFPSLSAFGSWLQSPESPYQPTILAPSKSRKWKNIVSNATTTTGLTCSGEVYTWTHDPRYPKCLGRASAPDTLASEPHPIPYLSETKIVQIASGGYMTVAVSDEGELFVWGQPCPGSSSTFDMFKGGNQRMGKEDEERDSENANKWERDTATMQRDEELPRRHEEPDLCPGSDQDEDQDEFIRCVPLMIHGRETKVTHVVVGSGHMVVAVDIAELGLGIHEKRAVFAIGQGENGQLGLGGAPEFVGQFRTVLGLKGRKVREMRAEAWSTWVVVEREG